MLVILKIPVIYLSLVVWWAVRAEPKPLEPATQRVAGGIDPRPGWRVSRLPSRRPRGPHGSPARGTSRKVARVQARAEVER